MSFYVIRMRPHTIFFTLVKMSVLEIPLDKKRTANCFVETRTKLELIPVAMIRYGLTRVQLLLWLQQSLFNGISWNGVSWAIVLSKYL